MAKLAGLRIYLIEDSVPMRDHLVDRFEAMTARVVGWSDTEQEGAQWLTQNESAWDLVVPSRTRPSGPGDGSLLAIDSKETLPTAAQMNVIGFHTWNLTIKSIDKPDRVILDLDPREALLTRISPGGAKPMPRACRAIQRVAPTQAHRPWKRSASGCAFMIRYPPNELASLVAT